MTCVRVVFDKEWMKIYFDDNYLWHNVVEEKIGSKVDYLVHYR